MTTENDPMELIRNMWGKMGFALPGMVAPTVDTDELGKRIADLKAVEGWLKSNLSLLQMTIQGLEMQRATLLAFQQMSQATQEAAADADAAINPFLDPAVWQMPWDLLKSAVPPAPTSSEPAAEAPAAKPKRSPRKKSEQGQPKG
ncbi:MAG: hypothetical protein KGZ43_05960 [Sulfuritalea sp.]|nr:hypothetical protein [Sulfuritalea sp.]